MSALEEVGFFGSCMEGLLWSHYEAMFFSVLPMLYLLVISLKPLKCC